LVREQAIATTTSLRREMDYTVLQIWYGKVQTGLTPTSDLQGRRRRRRKQAVLVACPNWAG
jgi:hypothetical protein